MKGFPKISNSMASYFAYFFLFLVPHATLVKVCFSSKYYTNNSKHKLFLLTPLPPLVSCPNTLIPLKAPTPRH